MFPLSYFVPAFSSGSSEKTKKRKRGSAASDAELDDALSGFQPATGENPRQETSPDRLENKALPTAQYGLARELSSHRSRRQITGNTRVKQAHDGLKSVGLRQQHAATLTTIMHKSLLKGDHARACRAWGMLLRTESRGDSLDIRKSDRWSLGAECILNRRADFVKSNGTDAAAWMRHADQDQAFRKSYSMKNLEQARDYYERLVLQYPYRKALPSPTSAQHFRLAIYGLWIYLIQEQHSLSKLVVGNGIENHDDMDASRTQQSYQQNLSDPRLPHDTNFVQRDILGQAREIRQDLEELLSSPPYSDDERFRDLFGMVEMWVGDLSRQAKLKMLPSARIE